MIRKEFGSLIGVSVLGFLHWLADEVQLIPRLAGIGAA